MGLHELGHCRREAAGEARKIRPILLGPPRERLAENLPPPSVDRLDVESVPLAEVETAWTGDRADRRIVFVP